MTRAYNVTQFVLWKRFLESKIILCDDAWFRLLCNRLPRVYVALPAAKLTRRVHLPVGKSVLSEKESN